MAIFWLVTVSEPDLKKDANTSLEAIGHALQLLADKGVALESCHINLFCDNTSRELKNNVTLTPVVSVKR